LRIYSFPEYSWECLLGDRASLDPWSQTLAYMSSPTLLGNEPTELRNE
jgi:hypothetical protein